MKEICLKILTAIYQKGKGRVSISPLQIVSEEDISDERLGDISLLLDERGYIKIVRRIIFVPAKTLENGIEFVEITAKGKELLRECGKISS